MKDLIQFLTGFYGPQNVLEENGNVVVIVDEETATGVALPSRYADMLNQNPLDWETPFLLHLSEIAKGYGYPITVRHYRASQDKTV